MTSQKKIFVSVLITSFMVPFMVSSINIAIPTMAVEFGVAAQELSWVITAYLLGSAALLVPFGRIADMRGRRRVYLVGVAAVALTTFLAGLAPSVRALTFFRLLQGLSSAMIFGTSMAMMVASHPKEERGKVIGYSAASTYIGLSLGPFLGGMVTQYFGWRVIFHLSALVTLLSCLLASRAQGEWHGDRRGGLDVPGCFLYSASSVMILYGLSAYASHPAMKFVLAAGIILLFAFIGEQRRSASPLIDISLFRSTIFAMSSLAALLNYSATFAISFLLSLYLQLIRGFDASTAGMFLLLQPATMAVLSPIAGSLSDRHEPRLVATSGMALTTLGLIGLVFLQEETPIGLLAANFFLIGIGFALFSSPNSNAVMGSVAPQFYGVASSVLSVMRISGQSISMAVVTVLLALYALPAASPDYLPSLLHAIGRIFAVLAISCAVGTGASFMRGRKEQGTVPKRM